MKDNMVHNKQQNITKHDIIGIIACILLITGLLVINLYLPDTRPNGIRRELTRQGHNVENVDFEFVRNRDGFRGWIFESSAPLYFNGQYVSQWSVIRYSFSSSLIVRYFVEPYNYE